MGASPILEEFSGSASGRMIGGLAGYEPSAVPPSLTAEMGRRPPRSLAI